MSPQRWQQVKEVFHEALAREATERTAYLNQVCASDPTLREEVSSLLSEERKLGSFIAAPAVAAPEGDSGLLGRRIGPYKVIRELGRGGMGVVLLGERDDAQFHKQVAIKLVRHGYDVDFILNRFRYERQILASFDHPYIARLLDGGTTEDGLPYFVMEYIEGTPLDRYCDEQRLDTTARLKLFQQVCDAVHYAHRNLVVHRDIKPSNILITAAGAPKLLDFGIAKILSPETFPETVQPTGTWDRPMTPAYASPEQVRGQTITTASDVYSLGVLLYELLTGHRPYHVAGSLPHELARVICEAEPIRPSTAITRREEITHPSRDSITMITPEQVSAARDSQPAKLRRQLKGDLDNIVLLALRKEPQRRYASVEQFAQDIQNYLEGRPVIARQDTLGYRTAKFIRRHKTGVAAAVLVLLTLLGGVFASLRQARIAERRFNDVRKLANEYLFEFHDAIEHLPGATPARQLVVKRALEYLDRLAQEASSDRSLQQELAAAYLKVGDVQGRPGFANLGDKTGALQSYRKSLALREAVLAAEPNNAQARREQAINHDRLGDTLRIMGDTAAALQHYQQALQVREALTQLPNELTKETQIALAGSYERIGDQLALTGKRAEALEQQRRALPVYEQAVATAPDDKQLQRRLFIGFIKLGDRLSATGDKAGALASYRQALPLAERLVAADAGNARAQREHAIAFDKVGNGLAAQQQPQAALENYQQALEIRERQATADPKNVEAQRDLATSFGKIAEMREQLGAAPEALKQLRRALTIDEALAAADRNDAQRRLDIAYDREKIGGLLAKSGAANAAVVEHKQAVQVRQDVLEKDPENVEVRRDLAGSHALLGELFINLAEQKQTPSQRQAELWREAQMNYQRSVALWNELRARQPLRPDEAADADKAASALAKCEQALARLR